MDSVVIPLVVPRPVTFLAKAEYFEGRGVSSLSVLALSKLFWQFD